ncbi:hypothetical protein AAG570_011144 [Ranatra chinensis]|uniref:Gamma-glutamylcyclotransferase n=1 Tax=Ranatra chinensis TaxID=642074 RepID=A0ABD0YY41_9HEMI
MSVWLQSAVWGRAFLVKDSSALPYLDTRECQLGGYVTRTVTFQPLDSSLRPFQALLYLATPSNHLWLGEAPEQEIAAQILTSSGPTGHNVEYLLRLADFMRVEVPGVEDDHLFALEDLVWKGIRERNLSIGRLMGGPAANQRVPPPASPPLPTNQNADRFAGRVPSKKLRCLGI